MCLSSGSRGFFVAAQQDAKVSLDAWIIGTVVVMKFLVRIFISNNQFCPTKSYNEKT